MVKIYMVFINFGFDGVKYFKNEKNARNYAEKIGEKVDTESALPHEYHKITFED